MTSFLKKRLSPTSLLIAAILLTTAAGCGEDFENSPREAVPIELTGVIKPERVTISPRRIGAGPISITISNQTEEARTVTLEGNGVSERVGPVNPQDTATIQKTVVQGSYEVRAASEDGGTDVIRPANIAVGRPRAASNDRILLP
jgi:hypothetical protein